MHDETDTFLAAILTRMDHPEVPVPMGVLHRNPDRATYDGAYQAQITAAKAAGKPDLGKLLRGSETWKVD